MQNIIDTLYEKYLVARRVTTDTRTITPGCLFFAFRGENYDGNAFASQALEAGAALCVISDSRYRVDDRCVVVDDVLRTLQQLALRHRRQLDIPVVGITGTNGKTTTKELVRAVLSQRYRVYATEGNHNNHLGVPLTILSIPADAEMAIIEMGANHPGEIADLCALALPTCGLITNVGKAHLEGFGSLAGVLQTKTELYRYLAFAGGQIFVNADDETLLCEAAKVSSLPDVPSDVPGYIPPYPVVDFEAVQQTVGVVTYGSSPEADVKGALMGCNPYMCFYIERGDVVYTIQSQLLGRYNFHNAMAAAAVGLFFNVDAFQIKEAIEGYVPSNNRSQYKRTERNILYLDCYNANPSSMKVAVESFNDIDAKRKVVILGAMRELGKDSAAEHVNLVDRLLQSNIQEALLVGDEFSFVTGLVGDAVPLRWFPTTEALCAALKANPIDDAVVLVKGSNSNRLWQVESYL